MPGHIRQWSESVERRVAEMHAEIVRQKQDIAPGELLRVWDDENLFQLPGGISDLDLEGKAIYAFLKVWYWCAVAWLFIRRDANRMPYSVLDRFVAGDDHRGNPVFGANNRETKSGAHLADPERCFYNRYGVVDKFQLSDDLRARYATLKDETIEFSETFGLAYTIGAHLYHPNLLKFAMEREVVDRVSSLLGDNVVLLSAHTFTKTPGAPGTPYHHGTSYQPVENTLTVFVGLTDCHEDNSCLRVIPGSEFFAGQEITESVYRRINYGHLAHDLPPKERDQLILQIAFTLRSAQLNLTKFQAHSNFAMLSMRIKYLLQNAKAREAIAALRGIKMELEPFEAFIFSERNFHCSGPNKSGRIRSALALRYAKGDEFIDDRRHLTQFKNYGQTRLDGLDKLFDEFVGKKRNAVICVAGDPEAARKVGNNVICAADLMTRMADLRPRI